METTRRISYATAGILFLTAVFCTTLFAAVWAKVFFGDWLSISFQNELPNILIFSAALTSLVVARRSLLPGKARTLLVAGLLLASLEVLSEIPLKKYVAAVPSTGITQWFFLFGLAEFVGMFLVLTGIGLLMRSMKKRL